jgi:hypothetical protein
LRKQIHLADLANCVLAFLEMTPLRKNIQDLANCIFTFIETTILDFGYQTRFMV